MEPSKSAGTVKLADKPTHFHVENMPKGIYIVIPRVSSERRHIKLVDGGVYNHCCIEHMHSNVYAADISDLKMKFESIFKGLRILWR